MYTARIFKTDSVLIMHGVNMNKLNNNNNNNNGRNGSFLRGWLPHRGKAQMPVITASPRGQCSK